MIRLSIFILLCFACLQSFALKEYYSLSRTTRALAMGGATYGLSDDKAAMFYNPAGISFYRGEGQFMMDFTADVSRLIVGGGEALAKASDEGGNIARIIERITPFQGVPLYAGANFLPHYLIKNFAMGLLIADTKASMMFLGREFDSSVDLTLISDTGLFLTYGRTLFNPNLHVGLTTKVIGRAGGRKTYTVLEMAQGDAVTLSPNELGGFGVGLDFDAGFIYQLPEFTSLPFIYESRIGLTITNLLATKFTNYRTGGGPPRLARTVSLGSFFAMKGWKLIDNFLFTLDIADIGIGGQNNPELGGRGGSFWKHVNLGLETPIHKFFAPRIGLHQGLFTAGFGLDFRFLQIDFAWYGVELASGVDRINGRRFALTVGLGYGSPPPAPIGPKPQVDPLLQMLEAKPKAIPKRKRVKLKESNELIEFHDQPTPQDASEPIVIESRPFPVKKQPAVPKTPKPESASSQTVDPKRSEVPAQEAPSKPQPNQIEKPNQAVPQTDSAPNASKAEKVTSQPIAGQ